MKRISIIISVMLMLLVVSAVGKEKKSGKMSTGCIANVPATGEAGEQIQFQIRPGLPESEYTPGGLASVDYFGETPVNMRFVPPSPYGFIQGSPQYEPGRNGDEGQFYHSFTRTLAVMETEITHKMWEELKQMQPTLPDDPSDFSTDIGHDHPVHKVTWRECILFANLISIQRNFTPCYYTDSSKQISIDSSNYNTAPIESIFWDLDANGYRLPTEGEWEYICRAGTSGLPFHILEPEYSTITKQSCNYEELRFLSSIARYCANCLNWSPQPVASREANNWNIFDTLGNVMEWCWDGYAEYPTGNVTDYVGGGNETSRILRGGYWNSKPENVRCAYRVNKSSDPGVARTTEAGFRLVRTLDL